MKLHLDSAIIDDDAADAIDDAAIDDKYIDDIDADATTRDEILARIDAIESNHYYNAEDDHRIAKLNQKMQQHNPKEEKMSNYQQAPAWFTATMNPILSRLEALETNPTNNTSDDQESPDEKETPKRRYIATSREVKSGNIYIDVKDDEVNRRIVEMQSSFISAEIEAEVLAALEELTPEYDQEFRLKLHTRISPKGYNGCPYIAEIRTSDFAAAKRIFEIIQPPSNDDETPPKATPKATTKATTKATPKATTKATPKEASAKELAATLFAECFTSDEFDTDSDIVDYIDESGLRTAAGKLWNTPDAKGIKRGSWHLKRKAKDMGLLPEDA